MTLLSPVHFVFSLLFLALACVQPSGTAQAAEAVGFVESKRGVSGTDVWIFRRGSKVPPRAGTPIYAGDQIRVAGDRARLVLRLEGVKGTKIVRKSNQPYRVPIPQKRSWGKWASNTLKSIGWAIGLTDRRELRNTASRSDGENETIYPPSALPLLESPKLYAVEGMSPVLMRWCGDAGALEWTMGKTLVSSGARQRAFGSATFFRLEKGLSGMNVPRADRLLIEPMAVDGQIPDLELALSYHIEWLKWGDVPRPDHLPEPAELSAEQRAEWAMWLIDQSIARGGKEHNLIAINLLKRARGEFWPAGYLLEQLTVCEGLISQAE